MFSSRIIKITLSVLLLLGLTLFAVACSDDGDEAYPARPMEVIIGFPPGGLADILARTAASVWDDHFDQSLRVVSRLGATGGVALQEGADAAADGYTLALMTFTPMAMMPHMLDELTFTPDDFEFIGNITGSWGMIVVHKDHPADTWEEFVEYAKQNPGLEYGASSPNAVWDIGMRHIAEEAGIDVRVAATEGGADAVAQLMGRHIDFIHQAYPEVFSHVTAGNFRAILVTGDERMDEIPDVPTALEMGIDFSFTNWMGLSVPAGTPDEIVQILREGLKDIMEDQSMLSLMKRADMLPLYIDGNAFEQMVKDDYEFYGQMIKDLGLGSN